MRNYSREVKPTTVTFHPPVWENPTHFSMFNGKLPCLAGAPSEVCWFIDLMNYIVLGILSVTVKMVEYHFGIGGVFWSEMCMKHYRAIGAPKAITWDHTPQSMKLGLNQGNIGKHIHRRGKSD